MRSLSPITVILLFYVIVLALAWLLVTTASACDPIVNSLGH